MVGSSTAAGARGGGGCSPGLLRQRRAVRMALETLFLSTNYVNMSCAGSRSNPAKAICHSTLLPTRAAGEARRLLGIARRRPWPGVDVGTVREKRGGEEHHGAEVFWRAAHSNLLALRRGGHGAAVALMLAAATQYFRRVTRSTMALMGGSHASVREEGRGERGRRRLGRHGARPWLPLCHAAVLGHALQTWCWAGLRGRVREGREKGRVGCCGPKGEEGRH